MRLHLWSLIAVLTVAGVSSRAAGHVDYVVEDGRHVAPLQFLLEVLGDPMNATLLGVGAIASVGTALGYLYVRPVFHDVIVFREVVRDYDDLIPWLLRLSFGLPLVGAGFAGYLFSPAVAPQLPIVDVPSRLFQIAIGFLLLFGLTTRAAAGVGLVVYLSSIAFSPAVLLANEFIPGLIAIVLVGSGRPSADHVLKTVASAEGTLYGEIDPVHRLAVRFDELVDPYDKYVATIVRVGLGVNFVFLGVTQKLLAPGPALAVVDKYDLTGFVAIDPGLWVVGAGLAEVALGLTLLIGLFTRASAFVALFVFTLTLFAIPDDPVVAHISLFGLASLLLITGSGPLAVDTVLGKRTPTAEDKEVPADIVQT